jgi:hypothetical protein
MKPRFRLTASGLCQALGPDGWIDWHSPVRASVGYSAATEAPEDSRSRTGRRNGGVRRSEPPPAGRCQGRSTVETNGNPGHFDLGIPTHLKCVTISPSVSGASARPPLRRVAMPEAPSLGASSLTAGASAPAFPFPLRWCWPSGPTQAARVDLPSERRRPASGFIVRHGMHDTTTLAARGAAVLGKSTGGI